MKTKKKNILLTCTALVSSVVIFFAAYFIGYFAKPSELPVYQTETEYGVTLYTSSITDVSGCHILKAVNKISDEYAGTATGDLSEAVYTDGEFTSGTYQILITGLDPASDSFDDDAKELGQLIGTDRNWHLTLYIPPILSSAKIYVNTNLVSTIGEIDNYEIDGRGGTITTETHTEGTSPVYLDLTFNSDRYALSDNSPAENGVLITIHCETVEGKTVSIDGDILIGEDSAVRAIVATNIYTMYGVTLVCASLIIFLVFICILKRTNHYVPQAFLILGVLFAFYFSSLYMQATDCPYLIKALMTSGFGITALGGAFAVKRRFGKIHIKLLLSFLAFFLILMQFFSVFAPAYIAEVLTEILKYYTPILALCIAAANIISSAYGVNKEFCATGAVDAMLVAVYGSGGFDLSVWSPLFVMCLFFIIITQFVSMREFIVTEHSNKYLTANLQGEVARQTADLQAVISEREQLLRFLSHDLRKPVTRIRQLIDEAKRNNDCPEIEAIEEKINVIDRDIVEIQKYSRTSYVAEKSETVDLNEIILKIYAELNPDCEANGIIFKVVPTRFNVYAKPVQLNSVIKNLIFNALEHSNCSEITIEARKEKNFCKILISDNGNGISNPEDIFSPYVSEEGDEENLGLGLYISRQNMRSMGGDLFYERIDDKTVFTVTVPLI